MGFAQPRLSLGEEPLQAVLVYELVSFTRQFSLKPRLHIPEVFFFLTDEILVTLGGGFAFLVFGIIYLVEAIYIT